MPSEHGEDNNCFWKKGGLRGRYLQESERPHYTHMSIFLMPRAEAKPRSEREEALQISRATHDK